ncbi:methyltransferase family protein [Microbacterium sp. NPDC055683]
MASVRPARGVARLTARHGRAYFAFQAAAGAAWWAAVFTMPPIRRATLGGIDAVSMAAFDMPLFVVASVLAACAWRPAVVIATAWTVLVAAGMAVYATASQAAGWGALLMIAAAAGSLVAAVLVLTGRVPAERILVGPFAIRVASDATRRVHRSRTARQIVAFWGLFLVVAPLVILWIERRWGLDVAFPVPVRVAGGALLVVASALGAWSGWTMSSRGAGTPLPSATARRLVIAGPYRFVRNPMALAGIAQGAAVGLLIGSWMVVAYALAGSLVWNAAVRPLEEADLEARFGDAFRAYRDRVPCWVPRLRG